MASKTKNIRKPTVSIKPNVPCTLSTIKMAYGSLGKGDGKREI